MTNAFINALKQQANQVQANIKKSTIKPKNEPIPHDYSDGNYQVSKQNGQYFIKPTIADSKTNEPAHVTHVDLVQSHNRIDIYFNTVPDVFQRNTLKAKGFRYNPDKVCWYHKDCDDNRYFLNERFCLDLEIGTPATLIEVNSPVTMLANGLQQASDQGLGVLIPEIKNTPIAEIQSLNEQIEKPCYITYKKQIAELLQALGCDFADLPLIAVDCLHKKTFN